MARFIRKEKQHLGQAPGSLVFAGIQKMDKIKLRVIDYTLDVCNELPLETIKDAIHYMDTDTVTWLNIDGLHDAPAMSEICELFGLDTMVMEDIMNTDQRPKVEELKDGLFVCLKMIYLNGERDKIKSEQISIIIKKNMLITFQEQVGDVFDPVRERIRNQRKRICNSGTDYLAYSLLDIVVDNYMYILDTLGEQIELLDDKIMGTSSAALLEEISTYKQEINYMRRCVRPTREIFKQLVKTDHDLISDETKPLFRELFEHATDATDASETYHEMLSDQLNIYHTTVGHKLNDIMKVLTIFTAFFIPLTFITGIYGTNFKLIPELQYKYSYFIMWGVMILITLVSWIYFKRKKWL